MHNRGSLSMIPVLCGQHPRRRLVLRAKKVLFPPWAAYSNDPSLPTAPLAGLCTKKGKTFSCFLFSDPMIVGPYEKMTVFKHEIARLATLYVRMIEAGGNPKCTPGVQIKLCTPHSMPLWPEM